MSAVHPDGWLTATGRSGTIRLPAGYVAEHVALTYACADIGAQGRTVYGGSSYADRAADVRNLYVAMTRGWAINQAFVAVTGEGTALDVFTRSLTTDWIDLPAHVRRVDLNSTAHHAPDSSTTTNCVASNAAASSSRP